MHKSIALTGALVAISIATTSALAASQEGKGQLYTVPFNTLKSEVPGIGVLIQITQPAIAESLSVTCAEPDTSILVTADAGPLGVNGADVLYTNPIRQGVVTLPETRISLQPLDTQGNYGIAPTHLGLSINARINLLLSTQEGTAINCHGYVVFRNL